jgi:uncharacterized Tic20 family protein
MKNVKLAKKIKELRKLNGLSQEALSETSKLNLRTIQRIEAGETEARGDTLKRLAEALKVSTDELTDYPEKEDRGFLVFLNLSALSFVVFPILGVIIPFILWVLNKDKIKYHDDTGKKLLNFQISLCLIICLPYISVMISKQLHLPSMTMLRLGTLELTLILISILSIINSFIIIMNCIRSYQGKNVRYPAAIPFLR